MIFYLLRSYTIHHYYSSNNPLKTNIYLYNLLVGEVIFFKLQLQYNTIQIRISLYTLHYNALNSLGIIM